MQLKSVNQAAELGQRWDGHSFTQQFEHSGNIQPGTFSLALTAPQLNGADVKSAPTPGQVATISDPRAGEERGLWRWGRLQEQPSLATDDVAELSLCIGPWNPPSFS